MSFLEKNGVLAAGIMAAGAIVAAVMGAALGKTTGLIAKTVTTRVTVTHTVTQTVTVEKAKPPRPPATAVYLSDLKPTGGDTPTRGDTQIDNQDFQHSIFYEGIRSTE